MGYFNLTSKTRNCFGRASPSLVPVLIILSAFLFGTALIAPNTVEAEPIILLDDAGPDDEPGQKDLNKLTVDFDPATGDLEVTWNWDIVSVSGNNTGDACSLYDTDNDGNANFSLCVIWGDDASYQTTRLYVCGDDAADKCTQPRELLAEDTDGDGDLEDLIGGPYNSMCDAQYVSGSDPFGDRTQAQADPINDTVATCEIYLDDFGGADAFLVNVCSYPSQVPGSDPSDCVVTPNSGFLTIVKVADPDDPAVTFTFNLGAGQAANDGRTSFSIDGSGSVNLVAFEANTGYDLTEVVPFGWQLDTALCSLSNGSSTGTFDSNTNTISDFEIQVGRETTCIFSDSLAQGTLTLVKTVVNDDGGNLTQADFPLFMNGTQVTSGQTVTFDAGTLVTASETTQTGYTPSAWGGDCAADGTITLLPGDVKECSITNDDVAPKLTLRKTVINDDGGSLTQANFPSFLDGEALAWDTQVEVLANVVHTASETPQTGYTPSAWGGDCAADGTITLLPGDVKECSITNDDVAPTLMLIKTVINDNGGTLGVSDFPLFIGDGVTTVPATSGVAVILSAGDYVASETPQTGYAASVWGTDCATDGTVSLAVGENKTCTITNDDIAPTLTVIKIVINNDSTAGLTPGDFEITVSGTAVPGGSITFPGQDGAGTAVIVNAGNFEVTEAGDFLDFYAQTFDGDCSGTLSLGQNAICTITNDDVRVQRSISVEDLTGTLDDGPVLSGSFRIVNQSEPGLDVLVTEYEIILEYRVKGGKQDTLATDNCGFDPEAPQIFMTDLFVSYACDVGVIPADVQEFRVTAIVMITNRGNKTDFSTKEPVVDNRTP